jgi:hypothetical protein
LLLWLASSHPNWFDRIIVDALPASAALMIPNYNGTLIPFGDNPQSKSMLAMTNLDFESNEQSVDMCNNKEKQN